MANTTDDNTGTTEARLGAGSADAHPLPALETRLVREAGRDTWFVVNRERDQLMSLPVELAEGGGVRRVVVNGEPVEFAEHEDHVDCELERPLRPGQGTTIVVHYR